MDLFSQLHDPTENLLPYDGEVYDFGCVYDAETAAIICQYLRDKTPWQHDEFVKQFGIGENSETRHIVTDRKVAWYAAESKTYTYAGSTKHAHAWSPAMLKLKSNIEALTQATYNACLLNLYHSGEEGMTWHSDSESDIVKGAPIASLSFGAERKFMLKHKRTKQRIDLWLASGQLIVMRGVTQQHWLHCVPKTKQVDSPRINLTFRSVV